MEAYTGFAKLYDLFMEDIPYDDWAETIVSVLRSYGIADGLIADLGCGTGQMTRRLAKAGYDLIGIDASPDMLEVAYEAEADRQKKDGAPSILYLAQDLRSFELYGTVRAMVSVCNTMNYLLTPADLTEVFRLANNYLDPGGIFVFDINTEAFYEEIGEEPISEVREEAAFIWENAYDPASRINDYAMTFFAKTPASSLYERFEEVHTQRAAHPDELKACIAEGGLMLLAMLDADTLTPFSEGTKRLLVITREQGKSTE